MFRVERIRRIGPRILNLDVWRIPRIVTLHRLNKWSTRSASLRSELLINFHDLCRPGEGVINPSSL